MIMACIENNHAPNNGKKMLKFIAKKILKRPNTNFVGSEVYWKERYKNDGTSGAGSYNRLAQFKADVINSFIDSNSISTAIEFGCGDGNQLKLLKIDHYEGYDISQEIIKKCKSLFHDDNSKSFNLTKDYAGTTAELSMSLDVIYHLVEMEVYEDYLKTLFQASEKFVIIYSSNEDDHENNDVVPHVKHRKFTKWVEKNASDFEMIEHIPNKYPYDGDGENSSYADFYIFQKKTDQPSS